MAASIARPDSPGDGIFLRAVGAITSSRVLTWIVLALAALGWGFHIRLTVVEQVQASLSAHGTPALTAHLAQEQQTSEQLARLDERVRMLQGEMVELRSDVKAALRRR